MPTAGGIAVHSSRLPFQPQAGEVVFHQGKGLLVQHRRADGGEEAFQSSVFISTQRIIFVGRQSSSSPSSGSSAGSRRILSVALDAIADESIVSRCPGRLSPNRCLIWRPSRFFQSDYVKFRVVSGDSAGKYKLSCDHLPRGQASHAVQKVYFIMVRSPRSRTRLECSEESQLFRLCEVRFRPVYLEDEENACEKDAKRSPSVFSSGFSTPECSPSSPPHSVRPCCLPGSPCSMPELHLPPPALERPPAEPAPAAGERHPLCTCPAGVTTCEGTCVPRGTRRRGSNGKIKQPFVDLTSGEVQYIEVEYEPSRVAFADEDFVYLAEESGPPLVVAGQPLAGHFPTAPAGAPPRQFSTKDLQRTLKQVRILCKRYH